MIVTFFGHAQFPTVHQFEQTVLLLLEKNVDDREVVFYLGNQGEFDAFAYSCCKKYQSMHSHASLILITPYLPQNNSSKSNHIFSQYDEVIYPEIEEKPKRFAIKYRNKWMVDHADLVICGIDHSWGGAYQACQYAKRHGKTVINITEKSVL